MYHEDLEKREGCVARERHESHISLWGELLAKEKQLKIFPFFKILVVEFYKKNSGCLEWESELYYNLVSHIRKILCNGWYSLLIFFESKGPDSKNFSKNEFFDLGHKTLRRSERIRVTNERLRDTCRWFPFSTIVVSFC